MTVRRRAASKALARPLTNAELTGVAKVYPHKGRVITCSKCSLSGGTLVKIDDNYQHQNTTMCRILQMRSKL